MVALNQASLFHWSQRADNSDKHRSIGYWQASRIQALLGNSEEARRYGEICLSYSRELEPSTLGTPSKLWRVQPKSLATQLCARNTQSSLHRRHWKSGGRRPQAAGDGHNLACRKPA
jgi:hypothetical protein